MNKLFLMVLAAVLIIVSGWAGMSYAEQGFEVKRFVLASGMENREPVGETASFPATAEKAYAFLEAQNIAADIEVFFVWHHAGEMMDKIPMRVAKGWRWRTYSNKTLGGLAGDWKVELQTADGTVVKSIDFRVE